MEEIAQNILETYWGRTVPIDINEILRRMKITIIQTPHMTDSGKFFFNKDGNPIIMVNTSNDLLRQRFSMAHELGHYVLSHGAYLSDPVGNFIAGIKDIKENEANMFALSILIPKSAIMFFRKNQENITVNMLAEYFRVSVMALRYRLKILQIV